MFIVFTGLDGTGTSSIAEKLAAMDEGSALVKTPSKEYGDRQTIDKEVRKYSSIGHFLYYLSSSVYMSDYIKDNLDYKTKNVYCVRYLIDTYVSNKVAGVPIDFSYNILGNELLKPDLIVFVNVEENIREKRITARGKSELDHVLDDEKTRNAFLSEFKKALKGEKVYYLDNTKEGIDDAVKELYEYIKKQKWYFRKGRLRLWGRLKMVYATLPGKAKKNFGKSIIP